MKVEMAPDDDQIDETLRMIRTHGEAKYASSFGKQLPNVRIAGYGGNVQLKKYLLSLSKRHLKRNKTYKNFEAI